MALLYRNGGENVQSKIPTMPQTVTDKRGCKQREDEEEEDEEEEEERERME